jgi:predicted esterase
MEEHVVRRLGLPELVYVAPAAAGQSWYPAKFMAPIAENQPHLDNALAQIGAVSDELAAKGIPPAEQIIFGFSQGACLACEFVYRRRQRFAALIALTGGLIGPSGTMWTAQTDAFRDMPVLLGGSDADPWVPASRIQETAEMFRALGARVSAPLYPSREHEIRREQIEEARELLRSVETVGR